MKLKDLIKDIDCLLISGDLETEVTGLEEDSRKVKPGDAFVCLRGANFDGHEYIDDVISKGAKAVFVEEAPDNLEDYKDVAFIKSDSDRSILGELAANFYNHPADQMTTIGITGTKGKTTVANMIRTLLESGGYKCGLIGTTGIKYDDVVIKVSNTTPDPLILHKALRDMVDAGYTHLAMEASSQGFKQDRMNGLKFDVGLMLNIDTDHIGGNEHPDFEDYLNCKLKMLDRANTIIVNSEDRIYESIPEESEIVTYSTSSEADYYSENAKSFREKTRMGTKFEIKGRVEAPAVIGIPGSFNVSNTLAAAAALTELGIDVIPLLPALESFNSLGRTELVKDALPYGRTVFVDYAHNKLSTESILKALRELKPKRIISLFGIRWYETRTRRYDLGFANGTYADFSVLTSECQGRPPEESFEDITREIIRGLEDAGADYVVIEDRKKAVEWAIDEADEDDIVALLGLGDERTQIINGEPVYFNESEIVVEHLKEKFGSNSSH